MEWTGQIDAYCERLGPEYWAEPVNALSNLAFLLAAAFMARRLRGANLPLAWGLVAVLFLIGLGSYLFHTHAQGWAALADTMPIVVFILLYLFTANRHYLNLRRWTAAGATALFVPFAAVTIPLFQLIPGIGSSAGYAPVPLLILIYALLMRRRRPETARGLAVGAGILTLSIALRAADLPLCGAVPLGTHFGWHLLNALMLGWMIHVYQRHMLAGGRAGR